MNPKEIIEKLPKYKNGSKAIPKDDVVIQYSALIQTIISLYEEEIKEIPEDEKHEFKVVEIKDIVAEAVNQERNRLRQRLQSKLAGWNELLVNSK